jgi:hypothetical protein
MNRLSTPPVAVAEQICAILCAADPFSKIMDPELEV